MAKVELKQPVVQAIAEDVKDATSVVLVDYRGLTVAEDTEMRKQLREAGVVYKVCKNTMMKRAFEGTDFPALDEHLDESYRKRTIKRRTSFQITWKLTVTYHKPGSRSQSDRRKRWSRCL